MENKQRILTRMLQTKLEDKYCDFCDVYEWLNDNNQMAVNRINAIMARIGADVKYFWARYDAMFSYPFG